MGTQLSLPIYSAVDTYPTSTSKLWLFSPGDEDLESVFRLVSKCNSNFEYSFIDALSGGEAVAPTDFVLIKCSNSPLKFSLLAPQSFMASSNKELMVKKFLELVSRPNALRPLTRRAKDILMLSFTPGARRSSSASNFISDIEYLLHLLRRVDVFNDPAATRAIFEDVIGSVGAYASPVLVALLRRCWAESLACSTSQYPPIYDQQHDILRELDAAIMEFCAAGHRRASEKTFRHKLLYSKYMSESRQLQFSFPNAPVSDEARPSLYSSFNFKRLYGVSQQFSAPTVPQWGEVSQVSFEKAYVETIELRQSQLISMVAGIKSSNLELQGQVTSRSENQRAIQLSTVLDQRLPVLLGLGGKIGQQDGEILIRPYASHISSYPEYQVVKIGQEARFEVRLDDPMPQLLRIEAISGSGIKRNISVRIAD
ncbi:MAG: hypothetical protein EP335_06960 [Alphaproteobacteria bacterium]|nr:MAG: hypothetical protein EP335_06960 [Alphaproteobacteria bacterium]